MRPPQLNSYGRVFAGVALLLTAACAARAQGGSTTHQEEVTHITTEGVSFDIAWIRDRGVWQGKLPIPADVAWSALPGIFGELGIDANVGISKEMVIGNSGASYRHTMGKDRLSHYFDCGVMVGMQTADSQDMWVRVIAQIVPVDGGLSKLRVEMQSTAKATDGPGGTVPCQSTGRLEQRMAKMIKQAAGVKTK